MEYAQGSLGRVFVARLEDGESIYDAVHEIAEREKIERAAVWAVGGMRKGKVVTGPENNIGRVIPQVEEFDDAREIVGFGTVFPQEGKPSLHFHGAIGRRGTAMVACPRIEMSVYLVLEVVIIEMLGLAAERLMDPEYGVHVLAMLPEAVREKAA